MTYRWQHYVRAQTNRRQVVARRDFLRAVAVGSAAAASLRWTEAIGQAADDLRQRGMACILLWMNGGPSQFETLSPKPGHANGGETKAIPTSVPGIHIAENLPRVANVMDHLAVIRSMTSREGSHPRARFLMHHAYLPMGSVKFPSLGSNVAHQIGDPASDIPSFVQVGARGLGGSGAGFLGVEYDPLIVNNPQQPPQNTSPATSRDRYQRRMDLLASLESDFGAVEGADLVADHRKLTRRAADMILSPKMEAFDLEKESASMREAYGQSAFGSGCLLARRLLESGVTFVEVTHNGWDTHQDNFNRSRDLCTQIDQPIAQLITDLAQRGMLDKTLVVWMGEFGRTPRINPNAGRDHYPRAFSVALAGGGVRGGQVIGATDEGGQQVTERPVQVNDLFRTIYHALKIDPDHENMSLVGRPIKLVDGGAVVTELFG